MTPVQRITLENLARSWPEHEFTSGEHAAEYCRDAVLRFLEREVSDTDPAPPPSARETQPTIPDGRQL